MVGKMISHYRILSQLGAGGMGVVYRAEDVRLGREVAVKFVSDDFAGDPQVVQRLRSEARAASALNHPNICTIYDVGEHEGRPFIVMELIKGQTLRDRLSGGPLRAHHVVDIGIGIADALHATHSDKIIHRDIKPGNIFLTDRHQVKVLDFGLAKTTRVADPNTTGATMDKTLAGVTLGTVSYMSPEQATGEELDGRTDLFSLGVVLYECATGRHPFPGKTSAVILSAILNRAPQAPVTLNPELPLRLQEVINNCLEKDRELRYQSAADLRADLKRLRRDLDSGHSRAAAAIPAATGFPRTARAPNDGTWSPIVTSEVSRPPGRSRAWIAAGAVTAALAIGTYVWWPRPAPPPAASAPEGGTAAGLSAAAIESRLLLARSSLSARNYRAAKASAEEILAVDAAHPEAASVLEEAEEMLARFDAAIGEARQQLAGGDVQATARALETARDLDPGSPSIVEISSRLSDLVRSRDQAARDRAQQQAAAVAASRLERPAPPAASSAAPAPPAPTPPPAPAPASQTPAPQTAPPPQPSGAPPAPTIPSTAGTSQVTASPAPSNRQSGAPAVPAPPRPPSAAELAAADEAAIRDVVATYGRAIENKDLTLFRSVKPNLSADEERRLQDGFRAVSSQEVNLTVTSLDREGDRASVIVGRRDVITVGSRQQTIESQQRLSLVRADGGWVITEIR